jgi:protein-disulfide isomerase
MSTYRRTLLTALAAPLALALAACGDSADDASPAGEPVAAVPAPAGTTWSEVVAITPEGGWLAGNPDAPIKLVEYGSLTCPACAAFSNAGMAPLREKYINSGRVSLELRSVPVHGTVDLVLTRVLECAPKEAAHPLAEQLWTDVNVVLDPAQANAAAIEQAMTLPENQRFVAYAQHTGMFEFFAARGLSTDQVQQCLADHGAIQALAGRLEAQNEKDGVTGTPTFFLNGARLDGTSWADVEPALQRAGAR